MARNIYKTLGERVLQERERAGLTQEELSERAGLTGAFVAHVERATRHATLDTIEKLAGALGVPTLHLLSGSEPSGPAKDDPYLYQFARLIRSRTPRQKKALLQVVHAAAKLIGK